MNTKYIAGIVAVCLVALLAVNFVAAGGFGKGMKTFAPSEEDREAMRTAIENKDYAGWKALMEQRVERMRAEITEENFNQMIEMHQNMNQTGMPERGMHKGMGKSMKGQGQNSGSCPYKQ
ncbi:hypothetical protein KA107_02780 [Candidatus Pacearchaeota archaeon]|nr:hypothetical protein [Candidatus Pacearchaeota archaeon]